MDAEDFGTDVLGSGALQALQNSHFFSYCHHNNTSSFWAETSVAITVCSACPMQCGTQSTAPCSLKRTPNTLRLSAATRYNIKSRLKSAP